MHGGLLEAVNSVRVMSVQQADRVIVGTFSLRDSPEALNAKHTARKSSVHARMAPACRVCDGWG